MADLLWLIPALPLAGFLINGVFHQKLPERAASIIGCLTPALSFVLSLLALRDVAAGSVLQERLFTWIRAGDLTLSLGLRVDALTAVMLCVVTGVGSLIHLYSIGYMHQDRGFARYFAYLNLFTFAMLLLVMGDNLVVMFVGWEGVGVCSYLLIGFWYENPHNADAGKKAFIVNRVGDLGFLLGIFTLFAATGTVTFSELAAFPMLKDGIFSGWSAAAVYTLAAGFLFIGACGKSAQIPLHVWLPDAMAGPTPVSALIHAATMVTAGVYMVGRLHFIYSAAPIVQEAMVVIAAATAAMAALIAVTQNDIKKVLAYSTISQLGYMFAGMATAVYASGVFHLMTHAFFKALLFLGAGAIIHMLGGEQDMRKMGGLWRRNKTVFLTFLVGAIALAGIPPFAGFHSKEGILDSVASVHGFQQSGLWQVAFGLLVFGAFLTALYMTRLVVKVFFGEAHGDGHGDGHGHAPGATMLVPLIVLAILSIGGGFLPAVSFVGEVWDAGGKELPHAHLPVFWISMASAGSGILLGLLLYARREPKRLALLDSALARNKFYFDELYEYLIVMPLRLGATVLWFLFDRILIDTGLVHGIGRLVLVAGRAGSRGHTGSLSLGMAGILAGAIGLVGYFVYRALIFRGGLL